MSEQLTVIDPKEFGVEESKALELTVGLNPILEARAKLIEKYNEIKDLEVTKENLEQFRKLRLEFQKNRTKGIADWHKVAKEVPLRLSQLLDAVKRNETTINENYETPLEAKEKHFENLEKERLKAIHLDRVEKLSKFNFEVGTTDFSGMDENMFTTILVGAEKAYNDKIEAEKKAEEERIAKEKKEAEEREAQRLENERLKKEAAEKEAQLQKEREEAAKKQAEIEAKAKKEREELERKAKEEKAKQDAILAEQKRLADIEAKKQADLIAKQQAELKAKQDAEAKAAKEAADKLEAERKEAEKLAKAPIKKQLSVWVDSFELPKSQVDNKTSQDIIAKFNAFKKWALDEVGKI